MMFDFQGEIKMLISRVLVILLNPLSALHCFVPRVRGNDPVSDPDTHADWFPPGFDHGRKSK